MILLIDNYDSFVYNLSRYIELLGYETKVVRNDAINLLEIQNLKPSHIIISPGPLAPKDAGICLEVIEHFKDSIPILGICLGHQAIGQAMGANVIKAKHPMHGKSSEIIHKNIGLFKGLPNPITVGRYHSLIIDPTSIPSDLMITATSEEGEIMAIEHAKYPLYGVQFHPESILTVYGILILERFFKLTHS